MKWWQITATLSDQQVKAMWVQAGTSQHALTVFAQGAQSILNGDLALVVVMLNGPHDKPEQAAPHAAGEGE